LRRGARPPPAKRALPPHLLRPDAAVPWRPASDRDAASSSHAHRVPGSRGGGAGHPPDRCAHARRRSSRRACRLAPARGPGSARAQVEVRARRCAGRRRGAPALCRCHPTLGWPKCVGNVPACSSRATHSLHARWAASRSPPVQKAMPRKPAAPARTTWSSSRASSLARCACSTVAGTSPRICASAARCTSMSPGGVAVHPHRRLPVRARRRSVARRRPGGPQLR